MSTFDTRRGEMFPKLSPEEIDRLRGFGVALDEAGFVRTGSDDHKERPLPLESNVRGVFAVGDVRSGSVKRIDGAIGEGAAVVAQLHTALADLATRAGSRA